MWTKQVCCDKGHDIKGLKLLNAFKLSHGVNSQTLNVTFVMPSWLSLSVKLHDFHLIATAGYLVKVKFDKLKLKALKLCL